MRTPKSVPMKRQPNGVTPKSEIPMPIISLPSGGWLTSYGQMSFWCSIAVRTW